MAKESGSVDNDILVSLITAFGPGILSGIGGFFTGKTTQENFNRNLALNQKSLDAQIAQFAQANKLNRAQLKQSWNKFVQTLAFQKKDASTNRIMQLLAPEIDQARREKNVLKSFSVFKRGGGAATGGTNVLAKATTAPQSALSQGV